MHGIDHHYYYNQRKPQIKSNLTKSKENKENFHDIGVDLWRGKPGQTKKLFMLL